MHLLWLTSIIGISLLHLQLSQCNDLELLSVGAVGRTHKNIVGNSSSGANGNDLTAISINNSMQGTIFTGVGTTSKAITSDDDSGETIIGSAVKNVAELSDRGIRTSESLLPPATFPVQSTSQDGIPTGTIYRGLKHTKAYGHQYGHPLSGLANLGIIIPSNKGANMEYYTRTAGIGGRKVYSKLDSDSSPIDKANVSGSNVGHSTYMNAAI
ncbi:uncharacterized protein LOC118735032 [Rhagoletis pomonella]|uniref:uncharacterized protein LOC118735032 n=1 Tax=Rhagoletis pomonella TaxID=28610 RepID=UPI0017825847|nr:uncharacterized protein LOC118735032 [Rhagoletis pomonella]